MDTFQLDLAALFQFDATVSELLARGSILYLGILFLMRILPRRTGGELATMDLIFILLIAEAAAHSLGDYSSIPEGFVLILTLTAWNWLINLLSYHFPFVEKLVSAAPLPIIREGKLLRRNMRREYLTEKELMDHLRMEGIDAVEDVQSGHVEGDGKISVVRKPGR